MLVSQKQLTVYIEKCMRSLGMKTMALSLPEPCSTSRAMRTMLTFALISNTHGDPSPTWVALVREGEGLWKRNEEQMNLTSSSLYQDTDSADRTNQYSLEPPFMMLMLRVSQPLRITCGTGGWEGGEGVGHATRVGKHSWDPFHTLVYSTVFVLEACVLCWPNLKTLLCKPSTLTCWRNTVWLLLLSSLLTTNLNN